MDLEDVFVAFEKQIYAYFLRLVGDPVEAEELTQETFYRACKAALRFRGESSVRTWLFGIAHRVLLEVLRSRKKTTVSMESADEERADQRTVDPEERVAMEQAFASVPVADRELLLLVDVLGFTPTEISATTGVEPGTLRVRLHRARAAFRRYYER